MAASVREQPIVVESRRKPPPESEEGIRTRSLVLLSFWAVIIFLGLPIWWWTTSIHRASLPLQTMLDWADGKVGHQWSSFHASRQPILINTNLRRANLRFPCASPSKPLHWARTKHSISCVLHSMPSMI